MSMTPKRQRERINYLITKKLRNVLMVEDRFGWDRLPRKVLEEYNEIKEELESFPIEQIEKTLMPKSLQVGWCKTHLINLLNCYRVQLALKLQPDPDDLWEAIQPFIDEEIETFNVPTKLPYPAVKIGIPEIDVQLQSMGGPQPRFNRHTLDQPLPKKIAQLILQLWDHVSDKEIRKSILLTDTYPINHNILNEVNLDLSKAIVNYLQEINLEGKTKRKPQYGFLNTFKSILTNQSAIPSFESVYNEIMIWNSKSIEELGHHQKEILGRIEVLSRFAKEPETEIIKGVKRGYKKWISTQNV